MPWVKLDEDFPRHPKIAKAGPLGLAMQVAGLCYCNRHLTDGFIPRSIAATLLDFEGIGLVNGMQGEDAHWKTIADELVEIRLWDVVEGGYEIHDYLEYQPSKDAVLAEREQKVAAGRAGGIAAATARAKAGATARAKATARQKGLEQAESKQVLQQNPSTRSSRIQADPVAESKPVPVPQPEEPPAEDFDLSAVRSETTGNGLPITNEHLTAKLLAAIGNDADDRTPDVIRALTKRLPDGSVAKVLESVQTMKPRDRAAYAVGALQSEYAELALRR